MSKIDRYKIGYYTDDWGMRSSSPSGLPDSEGAWVRYSDHCAALAAAPAQDDDALTAAYMAGRYDAKKAARAAAQPVAVVASKLGDICSFRSSVARKGDVVYFQPPAQAQDAHKPLTDEQIDRAISELGLNYLADAHETNRAMLRNLCHYAHGITDLQGREVMTQDEMIEECIVACESLKIGYAEIAASPLVTAHGADIHRAMSAGANNCMVALRELQAQYLTGDHDAS